MNYNLLKFLNHSSYLLESEKHILICDPWYEGSVFFEGWDLVSKEFSNKDVIEYLVSQNKKIHIWYAKIGRTNIPELISAGNTISNHEGKILNYFYERSTNAAAESFNAKLKGFRSLVRGVRDINFFLYRVEKLFS